MKARERPDADGLAGEAREAAAELWKLHGRVSRTVTLLNTTAMAAAVASAGTSMADLAWPTAVAALVCAAAVAGLMVMETRYSRSRIESLIERWERHRRESAELAARETPNERERQAARELEIRIAETRLASIGLLKNPYGAARRREAAPAAEAAERT